MTADDGYEAWLRSNPAPDLQELLGKHGSYDKIPPEAWAEHDRTMAEWQERRRGRSEGGGSGAPDSDGAAADPEQLSICGLPGVVSRERRGGGRPVWRCSQHSSCWPDYVEDLPLRRAAE